ncbi:MAG TPA: D-sedoheptulose 7-phosphate isomerase [Terriglobia bacterium]|nr:D-sedoheptulose 7-phosphate isomerase [Terriglobia bacterium]
MTGKFPDFVRIQVEESMAVKRALLEDASLLQALEQAARAVVLSLRSGGKVLLFGNGGSAADAQHIAAELAGRYKLERRGLAAIALTANTSALTAISNDYSFEHVYARQVEALGAPGDVAIGISTSGNSQSVVRGVQAARAKGLVTVAMTGHSGGRLKPEVDLCLQMPSEETPRIQETHILIGHILCDFVEQEIFGP